MKQLTSSSTINDLERWLRALDVKLTGVEYVAGSWYATVSGWGRNGQARGKAITATERGSDVSEAIMSALATWHLHEAAAMQVQS